MPKLERSKRYKLLAATHKTTTKMASADKLLNFIDNNSLIEGKESLAEEFDVSITTVERWIREGIPHEITKGDMVWRFHRGKVSRWRRETYGAE